MTTQKCVTVIGGGNMGEALVAGLLRSKSWRPSQITVVDIRPEVLRRLRRVYGVQAVPDARETLREASIVLLAVKPQQMAEVLASIGEKIPRRTLVLSIAAGIPTPRIEAFLSEGTPVVRVMPNTPALVGAGAAAIAAGRWAKPSHLAAAERMLATVGTVARVPESAMDVVTAVSGSGPAYVFYVAEAMTEAAVALGLLPEVADRLVRQTVLGAGRLLSDSAEGPQELRRRVTSPGGTTQAALSVLEQGQLKALFFDAVQKAAKRSQELSQEATKA